MSTLPKVRLTTRDFSAFLHPLQYPSPPNKAKGYKYRFFNAFGPTLRPNVCVRLNVGTMAGLSSIIICGRRRSTCAQMSSGVRRTSSIGRLTSLTKLCIFCCNFCFPGHLTRVAVCCAPEQYSWRGSAAEVRPQ